MRNSIVLIAVLSLIACEGPAGPMGPQGLQGIQGEQGPPGPVRESIDIGRRLSSAYDQNGAIIINDSRIKPTNFAGIHIQGLLSGTEIFYPVDYILIGISPAIQNELLPAVALSEGVLVIIDRDRVLITIAQGLLDNPNNANLIISIFQ